MTQSPPKPTLNEQIKQLRASTTIKLNPTPRLRKEIVGLDGSTQPLTLRYYQSQGIYNLLLVKRMILGDGTGLGKTLQTIGFLSYLWDMDPKFKAIVICPKSAIRQWGSEVERFTHGVKTFLAVGTFEERKKAWIAWSQVPIGPDEPKAILVTNYHGLVRDWDYGLKVPEGSEPGTPGFIPGILDKSPKLVTIFDEATAFKSTMTKTWQTAKFLSDRSDRVIGLTATLLKNRLMEGFAIFKVIRPETFGSNSNFMDTYCITELKKLASGKRFPIIVGYKNLVSFRNHILPVFLGRAKHEVSAELPGLTTREVICELSPAEVRKYEEALSGVLELGDGEIKDYEETKALTSLIYCQMCVDSPALLRYKDGDLDDSGLSSEEVKLGAKEAALLELLEEEFPDDKIIVYTKFASLVGRLQKILAKSKIKSVCITGKESAKKRADAQDKFQKLDGDTRVIFITDAGSEAINLQAAVGMVFYDSPWSWGNYVQLLGRMIRIGSPHPSVYAVHLVAERPGSTAKKRETIDSTVLKTLRKKKGFIDQIIGEAAVGALRFERSEGGVKELLQEVRRSVV